MANATIIERVDIHFPGIEVIRAVITDDDNIASAKFRNIKGGVCSLNFDAGGQTSVDVDITAFSGVRTAVLRCTGVSAKTATIVFFGQSGN